MRIGIIGAMEVEVQRLKEMMQSAQTETISSVEFFSGELNGLPAVVASAGVGKVNAAVCAQSMILRYNVNCVINIGIAGSLTPELGIGDIAVAADVVEHDMDTTSIGDPPGFITGINMVNIPCDRKLSKLIALAAQSVPDIKTITGTIASGDQFIASDRQRERIINNFGAIAAEMEGASIGHVCRMNNVPFAVLRAISDGANSDSPVDFPAFTRSAADNSIKIISAALLSIKEGMEKCKK